MTQATEYAAFLVHKRIDTASYGFEPGPLNSAMRDFQRDVTQWTIRRGRAALLEDCGFGKTLQQLVFAEEVIKQFGGMAIIHCPVGVRRQTEAEAHKFNIGVPVLVVDDQSQCRPNSIHLVNYEKMHHFDANAFIVVVLDESSILKSFTGKTKRELCEAYSSTRYKLVDVRSDLTAWAKELGANPKSIIIQCRRIAKRERRFERKLQDTPTCGKEKDSG